MQNQYQNHQKFMIGRGVILFQFLDRAIYILVYGSSFNHNDMHFDDFGVQPETSDHP